MKNFPLLVLILAAPILMAGCETDGLTPREQHTDFASLINGWYQKAPEGAVNEPMVVPIRLAVGQIGEATPDGLFVKELGRDPSLIGRLVPVPMPGEPTRTYGYGASPEKASPPETLVARVDSARNLARDLGANYLLLVGGSMDSYDSRTWLAPLDLTIVGGFILPGAEVHSEGKAAGAMIDVKTGRIVFLAEAELKKSGLSPTAYQNERHNGVNKELRQALLKKLAGEVVQRLDEVQSGAPAERQASNEK